MITLNIDETSLAVENPDLLSPCHSERSLLRAGFSGRLNQGIAIGEREISLIKSSVVLDLFYSRAMF
jgi:hypothetical protein